MNPIMDQIRPSPAAIGAGGRAAAIRFATGRASLGAVLVARSGAGICAILLGDDPEALVQELRQAMSTLDMITRTEERPPEGLPPLEGPAEQPLAAEHLQLPTFTGPPAIVAPWTVGSDDLLGGATGGLAGAAVAPAGPRAATTGAAAPSGATMAATGPVCE